ncbi:hypothetical protein SAMN05660297_03215 [Natronincola peptidivorans]|uniref:Uncharacterized protein n=1 Tax=Natronincola peptidivorans TaxID=426128 RepID=A0A1I0GKA9_9FIRM|nr:hypothetical protein [Natronincola peptidivorans]SET70484.1 hypothetical protein SAMN05660297_03215 [Natronincola peptidivorans]
MRKKNLFKVKVNKPDEEILEKLIAQSIAKTTMLRINKLPQNQRLSTLEEMLRRLKTADFLE